jgi:hypothetical protein
MIADNFNSKCVQGHYESAKQQAIAYLFTAGAKALVISEQKSYQAEDAFVGANEEAELKKEIINEERVKLIKRKLSENNPLQVYKYSRNEQLRSISLKVKHDAHGRTFFSWKSKNNIKKHFTFGRHTTVEPVVTHATESLSTYYANAKTATQYNYHAVSTVHVKLPYLRFRNSERVLDLRFQTVYEMEATLELLGLSPAAVWLTSDPSTPVPHPRSASSASAGSASSTPH